MKKNILHVAALLVPLLLGALAGAGQTVTDPSGTIGYDAAKIAAATTGLRPAAAGGRPVAAGKPKAQVQAQRISAGCFIPLDASYTALPRNDDGSFGPIALPFDFHLYGTVYRQAWINTNGNLTFMGAYSRFSSSGFPAQVPMVAPFWADVDTRNPASGAIHYKLSATNLIVTWDNVGYYNSMADKRNSFQAIIGSDADTLLGPGQNVSLRYDDMQWTTGSASGGTNGFLGVPSTVGVNNGNGADYVQVGRFNLNNSNYDGPGGAYDGVHYLDGQCFGVNVGNSGNIPPSASNMPFNNTVNVACGQTVTLDPQFLAPEVNQTVTVAVNTGGLCNTTVTTTNGTTASAHIVITGSLCNTGSHQLVLTATDNGSPTGITTVTLNVVVTSCCNLQLTAASTPVACPGGSNGALNLMVSNGTAPLTYRWSNGATTQNLAALPVGSYTVTATDANGCSATATYALGHQDNVAPTVLTRNITLPLSAAGTATLAPADVDNGSTDNCTFSLALDRTAFDCTNRGPNTVTLTATDAAGHSSSMPAIVTVVDTQLPTITAPAAVTATTDPGQCSASGVALGSPVAGDNCAGTLVTHNAPAVFPKGLTVVTWTATDAAGNVAIATQTVRVADTRAPIAVAQNVTVQLDATGNASITAAQVDNGSADACGLATVTVSPSAFTCSNVGPNTVTLTVTDTDGNVGTTTATATVVDSVVPTVRTRPVTVYLNAAGQASLAAAQVNNGSLDACGVASVSVGTTSFDCANLGPNNVSVTVMDIHGNAASSTVIVTVADTIAPTIAALPANISTLAAITGCSAVVHWTAPLIADNCSATLASSHQSGSTFPVGTTTVILTATDLAGNRTSRSFQVTVLARPMLASVSSPTFGQGSGNGNTGSASTGYNVSCFGGRTGTATVSVSGGCEPYRYLWSTGQTTATVKGLAAGTYTITITDANGTQTVRFIVLTQAPAIVATASAIPLTIFTGTLPRTIYRGYGAQSLTLHGTATGGVGGYTYIWAPATGLSSTTGSTVTASPTFTTTYTLTATDANGCTAAASTVIVNVLDVRCGNKNDKVVVCHNGHEICIAPSAVPAHLNGHPGDALGACVAPSNRTASPDARPADLSQAPLLEAYPNPFGTRTTIRFRQVDTAPAQVRLYDGQGRIVAVLFNGVADADHDYALSLNAEDLPTGLYLCRYESSGKSLVQRLIIVK
ncbi:nidogen-like domain-containing protein [Hymenobacter antarcticus]|uniref:HYR domain-containing protein n=1 Tax=Hymenobacter antarcticus TaxID=486270 RepID=A0ABP7R0L6_9BACT